MEKGLTKILKISILTFFISHIGFCQSIDQFIDNTIKVDSLNVPIDLEQPYFPKKLFPKTETNWIEENDSTYRIETKVIEGSYDEFVVKWYSEYLRAMKEPLLFNKKPTKEIYRFTWLRTFQEPRVIRIEKEKNSYKIFSKMLSSKGGFETGELIYDISKNITEKEWQNFVSLLKKSDFWNMDLGRSSIGNDGAEWILEGVTPKQYRVVTVWSPEKGDFYNVCKYLISLTAIDLNKE